MSSDTQAVLFCWALIILFIIILAAHGGGAPQEMGHYP